MTVARAILVFFLTLTVFPPPASAGSFLAGADVSHLTFFEARGVTYRKAGQAGDPLDLLKNEGINCIRLRLFTSSAAQAAADPYNSINNLSYTLPLAVRAKQAGLQWLLDFHYSDTWADPAHQLKPSAWTNLSFPQLVDQMRAYSSNCIAVFESAGAPPDYVQIGNEITAGLLWPDGSNASQWTSFAQLLKAAIQGVRDAATHPPQILIHIDRGADWATTQWFFDNLNKEQVPFDIIAQSYYPYWHGSLSSLSNCLNQTANRYSKPIIVAETDFPWAYSSAIEGIPANTNGQVQFAIALAQIVKSLPGGRGAGIFWWGAEYQPLPGSGINLGGFEWRSCFDNRGNLLPVASALGNLTAPLCLRGQPTAAGLRLTWPLSGAGLALTSTTSLYPGAVWRPVTNPTTVNGLLFDVTLPWASRPSAFYRLQSY